MFIEYKEGEKHAGRNADLSETMDSFRDCGLLLTNEDVVVDIDHLPKESIKALIDEFGIKTQIVWTDRGAHLWFRKPSWFAKRREGVCRLGFEIEQHTSISRPRGMTIKRNGVAREIENFDCREYLPRYFKIDSKSTYINLANTDEGEGRNTLLYNHRMALIRNDTPSTDIERICWFINKHVFANPLPDSEMENILRDVPPESGVSQQTLIATQIVNEHRPVKYSGMLWWRNDNDYIADEGDEHLIRKVYPMCEGEKTAFVDEIVKQVRYRSTLVENDTVFPIRFRNGILHNGNFIAIKDYQEFTPYFIDITYKPNVTPVPIVDEYIDNLTNKDPTYRDLLMEVIGYVMITDPERIRSLGKFFMFRGDGANGKGTLLQIMKKIYNAKNCTNLSIKQLTDDRYKVTMIGKLANLGDDIEAEAIDNDQLKVLKNISTADTVTTRHMYSESISTTFTIKLYFTTNSDISSFEKGYAYKRRIVWLPMFNKVEKPDPRFITKMTTPEALEYWISLIVEGYKRLYKNMDWTSCKVVEDYNSRYHENNNVCARFAKDLNPETEIIGKTVSEMRDAFIQWDTEDNKFRSKLFKEAVWDLYKIGLGGTHRAGKRVRVFMHQDDSDQVLDH